MRGTKGGFVILTLVLTAFIIFCSVKTVQGQEDIHREERERWYQEREEELLEDTRRYLNEAGFPDSGVTLSRKVDSDGSRSYTFTIHHRRIDSMSEAQRQALGEELKTLTDSFAGATSQESCSFGYKFLIL